MDPMGKDFVATVRHNVYPAIDPTSVHLPKPFTVCIAGTSRGIGAHIVYAFARAGADSIAVCSPTAEEVEASEIPQNVTAINPSIKVLNMVADVTLDSSLANFAAQITSHFGRLDVLICNAGVFGPANDEPSAAEYTSAFQVNCVGAYLATQRLMPLLLASDHGARAVITVCSAAACAVGPGGANQAYCISKMAQARFVERLALKYEKDGVFAAAVHPGAVKTEMAKIAPKDIFDALPDSADLCGSFIVWLVKEARSWLRGRYLSANWDVDELSAKQEEIVKNDKLKFKMTF